MATVLNDLLVRIDTELQARAFKDLKQNLKSLESGFESFKKTGSLDSIDTNKLKELKTGIDAVNEPVRAMQKNFKELSGVVLNSSLSMLFFGMALQRVSVGIIKSALEAFNKITTGGQEAGGAIGVLSVHFELLKFSIGSALNILLEAFLPTIINVILFLSDWVQQNSKLTAGILLGSAALGAFLVIAGTIGSALNPLFSILSAFPNLLKIFAPLTGGFNSLLAAITGLTGATGLGAVAIAIGVVIAAVVALWAAWKTNLGNIQEAVKDSFGTIIFAIKSAAMFIFNTFKNLTDIIVGIFEGDWQKVGNAIIRLFSDTLLVVLQLWSSIMALAQNIVFTTLNVIKDLMISILLELPLALAKKTFDFFGLDEQVAKLEKFEKLVDDFKKKATLDTITGEEKFKQDFGSDFLNIDKLLKQGSVKGLAPKTGEQPLEKVERSATDLTMTFSVMDNKMNSTMKSISESGMNASNSLNLLKGTIEDSTTVWTKNQFALQKALGIHEQGKINFQTGTFLGDAVLRSMFGDKLGGVGQFQPGMLSKADVRAGGQGGTSVVVDRSRPQIMNNPIFVQNTGAGNLNGF